MLAAAKRESKSGRVYKRPCIPDLKFSLRAEGAIKEALNVFDRDLRNQSQVIASKRNSERVEDVSIARALQKLRPGGRHSRRYFGAIGGVLLGSSFSTFLAAFAFKQTLSPMVNFTLLGFLMIGSFLLAREVESIRDND